MFKRDGDNLEVEVPLTIPEAVRGAVVEVPTLRGSKRLRVPAGTKHGTVQRLRGEGPPRLNGKGRGDIHYRFVIDVPESLSPEQQDGDRPALAGDERQPAGGPVREQATGAAPPRAPRPGARADGHRGAPPPDPAHHRQGRGLLRRGVFMISVAAELAEMHPQTLRMYEARGLIEPKRSPKGTRLYSHEDVERLRRIQEMTAELGMNLAGVERVFELEEQLEAMARQGAGAREARRRS